MKSGSRVQYACYTRLLLVAAAIAMVAVSPAQAQQDNTAMAKLAQNPVGNVYNLPFQNNTDFKVGPNEATNNTLNIQPVIPVTVGKFNLINRGIIPFKWQGETVEGIGSESGLGDITYEGILSPGRPGKVIWGVGAALIFPTATKDRLGTGKWQAGPAIVVLTITGPWVMGAIAQNTWSFAGDDARSDVNFFFSQIFVNYNIKNGWYLTSQPIITANWEAESGQQWSIPLGGGIGKTTHLNIPVDFQLQAFYYVEKPEFGPDWQLRIQIKPMIPK